MKLFIFFIIILSCFAARTQSNIVALGADLTGTGGSVSATVGQIDYSNQTATNGSVHQGVQQPYEFFETNDIVEIINHGFVVYPNPFNYNFWIISGNGNSFEYTIHDAIGRMCVKANSNSTSATINTELLASGMYTLIIHSEELQNTIFKIIKTN